MRIGTLALAVERGLGYLAKSFVDNGVITDVCIMRHSSLENHMEWYPGAPFIRDSRGRRTLQQFVTGMDVMLFFETPFDWQIIPYCREVGTKTVLMTMYECTPDPIPHHMDRYLCPSLLDLEYFPKDKSIFIPVPVDEPWEQRMRARVFAHNSGHIGLKERSGTRQVLEAMKHVNSPIELIVRSQNPKLIDTVRQVGGDYYNIQNDPRVKIEIGHVDYTQLRKGCDVCVAPEKFNGLSLPLQECRAIGLLVMTTDRFPANTWLPTEPLIPVSGESLNRVSGRCIEFLESIVDPIDIAAKIDEYFDTDISQYSREGRDWAATQSWEVLKPRHMKVLTEW